MADIKIWHNPRCSKSRNGVALLESEGVEYDTFKYLDESVTADEIREVLAKLGIAPRELMRTKEDIYKELGLKNEQDDEKLIEAMAAHPRLIERPIVIKGDKAVIGRPEEKIVELIKG